MAEFDPAEWPKFIELPGFTREWTSLGLSDVDLTVLQGAILEGPNRYPVISGTGGLAEDPLRPAGRRARQERILPGLLRWLSGQRRRGPRDGL